MRLKPKITVVGLGPADESFLTTQTRVAISEASRCFVRTFRHPGATVLPEAVSFDDTYEQGESFEVVYQQITKRLLNEVQCGDLLYAVPGSPLVLERTVELLREAAKEGNFQLEVLAAMSFLDLVWSRLAVDPHVSGVRLVDGQDFVTGAAGQVGPFLVAQCHSKQVLSEIKLAVEDSQSSVVVMQSLGLPNEAVFEVRWADLDKKITPDHLTSLWIPALVEPVAAEFVRFEELVRELRSRCVWDQVQTHGSLSKHFLEESFEVLEVLDARSKLDDSEINADLDAHLVEELGDLLYQIFFHSRIGAERGSFTVADVVRGIHDKLVDRHPHVFAETGTKIDIGAQDPDDLARRWEENKHREKGRTSVMDGIPTTLPALMLAAKVQERASNTGEETYKNDSDTTDLESRLGVLLFEIVAYCRDSGIDAETALRRVAMAYMRQVRRANK